MAPSPSPDPVTGPLALTDAEAQLLVDLAEAAILDGLAGRPSPSPSLSDLPPALRQPAGAFVTVTVDGALNGCIGTIEGAGPLGVEVVRLARSAAFSDPRLPALRRSDLPGLVIEVSVLSPFQAIPADSRDQLLAALRPGTDGLLLEAGPHRAVFLPDVWRQLPDPSDFVDHLYRKGGLVPGTWPPGMRAFRFTTDHVERPFRPRA